MTQTNLQQQTCKLKILEELENILNSWSPYVCQSLPIDTLYTHRILTKFINDKLKQEKECLKLLVQNLS